MLCLFCKDRNCDCIYSQRDDDLKKKLGNKFRGVGTKSTVGIRNFNLRRSQVRKRGKIGLNQSVINI